MTAPSRRVRWLDVGEAARQQRRRVADEQRPKVPKLAALIGDAGPDVLADMSSPHRAKLQGTNPLQRLTGAIERRTGVERNRSDRAFLTVLWTIGAILPEQTDGRPSAGPAP